MTHRLHTGKVDRAFFERHIVHSTGAARRDVIRGPEFGVDFGVIDTGGGRAMAVSTDPIWVDRVYGIPRAAWFAFHTIVGDVALSGLPPSHLALDWNLPGTLTASELRSMLSVFDREARELGMSIVTGHTGVYEGAALPAAGGGTAIAVGMRKDIIWPDGARSGDVIVMTKGPAVETAVSLCFRYPEVMREVLGAPAARRIRGMFRHMSVVRDARVAARVAGTTSMHDASERGIAAALNEVSHVSGHKLHIDEGAVEIDRDVASLCSELGLDPYACSSEGALVITTSPRSAESLIDGLKAAGISAFRAGRVGGSGRGVRLAAAGGGRTLRVPESDHLLLGIEKVEALRNKPRRKHTSPA